MEITSSSGQQNESQLGDTERWASLIGGGALVLYGLSQRSLRGALLAIAGGGLAYHGATGSSTAQEAESTGNIKVEKTVTIDRPVEELYRYWRNFENLPRFMKHLKLVTIVNPTRSHWIASAPMGGSVEWDAEIINEQENRLIAWTSLEGADIENSGFVRFQAGPPGRGTEVKVVIEYNLPGGGITNTVAKLFGESPEQQIGDDLRRFKQIMEAGEIATIEGQPAGR